MAVTQQQVDDAYNNMVAAQKAASDARQELESLDMLSEDGIRRKPQIDAKIARLEGIARDAESENTRVSAGWNRENPNKPAMSAGQAAADAGKVKEEADKDKNEAETGIRETTAQRLKREQTTAPKPMTQAQVLAANNAQARLAETRRANAAREQGNQTSAQVSALKNAADTTTTVAGQVATEIKNRYDADVDQDKAAQDAARKVIEERRLARGQNIEIAKARNDFGQSVLTTVLPRVAEMMAHLPKGSRVAQNFLVATLAMANDIAKNSGLMNDIPELDENSPEMRVLREAAGRRAGMPPPKFPDASEVSWGITKRLASLGVPPLGYNGPIGVGAMDLPDKPKGTMGDGSNPLAAAQQSEEGAAIANKYQTQEIKDAEARVAAGTGTEQDKAAIAAARQAYNAEIAQLATKQKQQTSGQAPGNPNQDPMRAQVRSSIMSGTNDEKLKTIALVSTAAANKAAGKPLSTEEIQALSTIDPEDVAIISRSMTPQVSAILAKQKMGQALTSQELQLLQSSTDSMTKDMKARNFGTTPIATPAIAAPTPPPQPLAGPPQATPAVATDERTQMINEVREEFKAANLGNATDESAIAVEADMRLAQGKKPKGSTASAPVVNPTPYPTTPAPVPEQPAEESMPKLIDPAAFQSPENLAEKYPTSKPKTPMPIDFSATFGGRGTPMNGETPQTYTFPEGTDTMDAAISVSSGAAVRQAKEEEERRRKANAMPIPIFAPSWMN